MEEVKEINGNYIGKWEYDVFITESGDLGFTVYEKGKNPSCGSTRSKDIFIDENLNVKSI